MTCTIGIVDWEEVDVPGKDGKWRAGKLDVYGVAECQIASVLF
jgi:hypothetical protein